MSCNLFLLLNRIVVYFLCFPLYHRAWKNSKWSFLMRSPSYKYEHCIDRPKYKLVLDLTDATFITCVTATLKVKLSVWVWHNITTIMYMIKLCKSCHEVKLWILRSLIKLILELGCNKYIFLNCFHVCLFASLMSLVLCWYCAQQKREIKIWLHWSIAVVNQFYFENQVVRLLNLCA